MDGWIDSGVPRTLRGPRGRDALDNTSNLRNTSRGSVFLRPRDATNSAILRSSTSSVISSISAEGDRIKRKMWWRGYVMNVYSQQDELEYSSIECICIA